MTTVSPIVIDPASGGSWPTSIRNSVVLPAPFGPMIPTIPERGSENVRSSMSSRSPKPLRSPSTSMTWSPRRGPGGMAISSSRSVRFASFDSASSCS